MFAHQNLKWFESSEAQINMSVLSMLTHDMQDVLNKYLINFLVSSYSQRDRSDPPGSMNFDNAEDLNQIALNQRKNFYIPVPRYPWNKSCSSDEEGTLKNSACMQKQEITPDQKTDKSDNREAKSLEKIKPLSNSKRIKSICKSLQEIKQIKMDMTFDNETGWLATRWDVVYKTILRDFRRYFLEEYKVFKAHNFTDPTLSESIFQFTFSVYPEKSPSEWRGISLDLGSLLFPKEIVKDSNFLQVIQEFGTFGDDVETVKAEIMKIHGFLYKFSIDKIEECFQNISLSQLFITYIAKASKERMDENLTMKKNSSVYLKAMKILESRASECFPPLT